MSTSPSPVIDLSDETDADGLSLVNRKTFDKSKEPKSIGTESIRISHSLAEQSLRTMQKAKFNKSKLILSEY